MTPATIRTEATRSFRSKNFLFILFFALRARRDRRCRMYARSDTLSMTRAQQASSTWCPPNVRLNRLVDVASRAAFLFRQGGNQRSQRQNRRGQLATSPHQQRRDYG